MRLLILPVLAALSFASPALAETRGFTVTGFDRIRITGPFTVRLRTGSGSSARAQGPARGLDRLRVEVQGGTLIVSADRTGAVGWANSDGAEPGQVILDVATPTLVAASLTGSGTLTVDRAKAASFALVLAGSGDATIGALTADRLAISVTGSGQARIAGTVAQARAVLQGSGGIDGAKLLATDVDVTVAGSGNVSFAASRTAKVAAAGAGDVTILGDPACTVRATGSGEVRCGKGP